MAYVNVAVGVIKVGGALIQGKSDRMLANTQGMALDYQADQEQAAAMQEADIIRRARDYSVARADAAYAASGVAVGVGSAAETERQIESDGTHDAYMAILTGEKRANALRANASIVRAGGQLQAQNDYMQGVGGALSAGAQAYTGWATMQNQKPRGG